ncbi:MAG TPA: response regulator transcription factor [bacterium]|nr:response regulator transcription factor [bacterium]
MSAKIRVLVIDDDVEMNELLKDYLSKFEITVFAVTNPEEGLRFLKRSRPDLVLLDVMLPKKDGFAVCKEIRQQSKVPIIMLTGRGEVTDRVVGLEIGADDYLSKPFDPRELVARINTVLRRLNPQPAQSGSLVCGSLKLDLGKGMAYLKGKPVNLTTNEFEMLAFFMKNPGIMLNRDKVMEYLQGIEGEAFNRSVDIAISRIRKKIGDSVDDPKYFKTFWGSGYIFIGKVTNHGFK